MTTAGSAIVPVPRTMLPSVLTSQMTAAPPKMTREYVTAASSASPVPPMARYTAGPPRSKPVVNRLAIPRAITTAWPASAWASARRPAPSARATAEATPPPMPPADMVCISMTRG
jgi:hypothetical protein